MVNFRGNTATDPEWAESLAPGWQEERINNFEDCLFTPNEVAKDLVADGWTDLARSLSSVDGAKAILGRSEEHTSELQSLMRISYAVFCLKKKKQRISKILTSASVN